MLHMSFEQEIDLLARCSMQIGTEVLAFQDVYLETSGDITHMMIETQWQGHAVTLALNLAALDASECDSSDRPTVTECTVHCADGVLAHASLTVRQAVTSQQDPPFMLLSGYIQGRAQPVSMALCLHPILLRAGSSVITRQGDVLRLTGRIGTAAYPQMEHTLNRWPDLRMLSLDHSDGSVNDRFTLAVGRLVRAAGLDTSVPADGDIVSGAVDLFLAGVSRRIAPGAKLGVHAWSDADGNSAADYSTDDPRHADQLAYVTQMLGPDRGPAFYWFTLRAAPVDGMHYMTSAEIAQFGLETAQ